MWLSKKLVILRSSDVVLCMCEAGVSAARGEDEKLITAGYTSLKLALDVFRVKKFILGSEKNDLGVLVLPRTPTIYLSIIFLLIIILNHTHFQN